MEHFGLRIRAFSNAPDTRFVYLGTRHEEALAQLLHGVREQGGFVQLTGATGTGKTTVCRLLLNRLPEDIDVALILNPVLTSEELLTTICDELGVSRDGQAPNRAMLVEALGRHLHAANAGGRRTVLIVDDAQSLSVGALEELHYLTNFEVDGQKLLQIILIGQPELIESFGRKGLHQLSQRITTRHHLLPFAETETCTYVRHRMTLAGGTRSIFESGALLDVHRLSGGVPGLINVICERALLGAHTQRRSTVDRATVRQAARNVLSADRFKALKRADEARRAEELAVARGRARGPLVPAGRPLWPWIAGGMVVNAFVIGVVIGVTRLPVVTPTVVEREETPTVAEEPGVQARAVQPPTQHVQTSSADMIARSRAREEIYRPREAEGMDSDQYPPPDPDMAATIAQLIGPPPQRSRAPAPPPVEQGIAAEQPAAFTPVPPRQRRRRNLPGTPATSTQVAAAEADSAFKVEMLVWAANPRDRLVYMNGRKYVEGDALENGAVIEQIAQDGVVLAYAGRRIRVQPDAR